ncbi:MAG TPA: YceI family protein [Pseudoxanthomonas sp.]|nr:YceI family protein [Pseudoxanthomonas sp.]
MRPAPGRWLALWLLVPAAASAQPGGLPPEPAPAVAMTIDTARSHLGFEVRTRLGQRLEGVFPRHEGLVERLPDGRHRVRLRVATVAAEIPERPRYTAWMRGESFFDTLRHPWMEFVSDPYEPRALAEGGALHGRLTLRGVTRAEALELEPAACPRPGLDCPVEVRGDIERSRYGMDDWRVVLSDRVRFLMQVWLKEAAP